jgi:NADH-quinone oxidoreductase subunit I
VSTPRDPQAARWRRSLQSFVKSVSFSEIIKGLSLTLRHLFSPPVTRQYPEEKREPVLGSRGLHALVRDSATGDEKCVGCCLCAAMCPSNCIHIYTSDGDDQDKVVDRYELDVLRCVYCGFCVEACPYGAIVMTEHFAYSGTDREAFRYSKCQLLENWDRHLGEERSRRFLDRFWRPRRNDFERRPNPSERGEE